LWWHISRDTSLADDLCQRLENHAFPFFERFKSRDAILEEYNAGLAAMDGAITPPRILCTIILYERGRKVDAEGLIQQEIADLADRFPSGAESIRLFAERLGLNV